MKAADQHIEHDFSAFNQRYVMSPYDLDFPEMVELFEEFYGFVQGYYTCTEEDQSVGDEEAIVRRLVDKQVILFIGNMMQTCSENPVERWGGPNILAEWIQFMTTIPYGVVFAGQSLGASVSEPHVYIQRFCIGLSSRIGEVQGDMWWRFTVLLQDSMASGLLDPPLFPGRTRSVEEGPLGGLDAVIPYLLRWIGNYAAFYRAALNIIDEGIAAVGSYVIREVNLFIDRVCGDEWTGRKGHGLSIQLLYTMNQCVELIKEELRSVSIKASLDIVHGTGVPKHERARAFCLQRLEPKIARHFPRRD